ncbi:MAG TPA: hypothetical protein VKP65_08770 [Rhodothermales bacterium]|nr:hypothetical protein [Rhodothermales bacterium]
MKYLNIGLLALVLLFLGMTDDPGFSGSWTYEAEGSTAIDPWRRLSMEIDRDGDAVILKRIWRGSREGGTAVDSAYVVPGGPAALVPLEQWPDNRHLGAYLAGDSTKTVTAHWDDEQRTLITESHLTVSIQQGTRHIRIYTEYRLSPDGNRLDVLELRSTRPKPIHYIFRRADDA